jgi:hypothetical protein
MSRLDGGKPVHAPCGSTGTFKCLIDGCPIPKITRSYSFRRHILHQHPDSIHAKILKAVVLKTKITLPSPPPVSEYIADFETGVTENALLGTFDWRAEEDWNALSLYIRTEIAHAKLIQGKYGVLAPKTCANCRQSGTTCMVYQ